MSNLSVASATRPRQHLDREFEDQPERAERAGQQARDVVARDVLHHLAAEVQHLALAVHHDRAEHEVARRAGRTRGAGRRGPPRCSRRRSRRARSAAARTAASGRVRAAPLRARASGVPARAVMTSSVGSYSMIPRCARVSSSSPCSVCPYQSLVPPPRMRSGVLVAVARRIRSDQPATISSCSMVSCFFWLVDRLYRPVHAALLG